MYLPRFFLRTKKHSLKLIYIAPENRPSQKEIHLPTIDFKCNLLISGRVYIPRTQLTSVFEDQPSKNKALFNQNKGHLGSRYVYIQSMEANIFKPRSGDLFFCWADRRWIYSPLAGILDRTTQTTSRPLGTWTKPRSHGFHVGKYTVRPMDGKG